MMKTFKTGWCPDGLQPYSSGDRYEIRSFLWKNLEFESIDKYFDFSKENDLYIRLAGLPSSLRPIPIPYNDIKEVILTDTDLTFKLGRAASLVLSSGEGLFDLRIKKENKDD